MKKVKRGASGPEPGRRVGVLTISVFRKWKHIRGRETVRPQRADNAVQGLIFIVRPQGKHHGTKPRIGGWSRTTVGSSREDHHGCSRKNGQPCTCRTRAGGRGNKPSTEARRVGQEG